MENEVEDALVARLAKQNDVSPDGVKAVLDALRSSGGRMAQFSHADFGGMSQWSSGMTMVGDMFNDGMKTKLNAVASELSKHLQNSSGSAKSGDDQSSSDHSAGTGDRHQKSSSSSNSDNVSYRSEGSKSGRDWWPENLGSPSSVGAQNDIRYAVFPQSRRLAIDDHGKTKIYDTADHQIHGVGQSQGSGSTLTFTSQSGVVRVSDLSEVD